LYASSFAMCLIPCVIIHGWFPDVVCLCFLCAAICGSGFNNFDKGSIVGTALAITLTVIGAFTGRTTVAISV
jgi:hypothetical protein